MLDDLAWRFSELDGTYSALTYLGLFFSGGLVGGLTCRSFAEIQRAPYYALSGLVYLACAVVSFAGWIFVVQAIVHGYFWTLVALDLVVVFIGGVLMARLSVARSRDAHGHGRFAFLGLLPIANFWLVFKPSRNEESPNRVTFAPGLTAHAGAFAGILLFAAGRWLSSYAEEDSVRRVEEASAAGAFAEVILEQDLRWMATQFVVPNAVDRKTTLVRVAGQGTELKFTYEVDSPIDHLPEEIRFGLLEGNCSPDEFLLEIEAGAVIKHVYVRRDGTEFDMVEISEGSC